MEKVSDYIFRTIADCGVRHVFVVTGGGAMHLNDSIGKEQRIQYICNHHEQASAMAAEGYARVNEKLGVVNVTAGPGGINAINGVFGAWTDSIPMLIISGQAKRETLMRTYGYNNLRQLGDQEVDIIEMIKGITKYAVCVTEPETIRYHLEKSLYLAENGRPGPCWLDIPVDVQGSQIQPSELTGFEPEVEDQSTALELECSAILQQLQQAERPVILAGTGIRQAKIITEFNQLVNKLGVPVTTAWTHDIIPSDSPYFIGRPGTIGERAGNFCVQNSDLLLILGSRLNIRQVSYNYQSFARAAYKIQIDVDPAEMNKPFVKIDHKVTADLKHFIPTMLKQLDQQHFDKIRFQSWVNWCTERKKKYPVVQTAQRTSDNCVNAYYFIEQLNSEMADDDVVVCGDATATIVPFQVMKLNGTQRLISNSGCASMGHDLPASIGAAVAREGKRVICLAGDGSLQMNIQELQTIIHHQLNIKLFVLENGGYLSIRQTQQNFFGRAMGAGPASGVSFPDTKKVAEAYGFKTFVIKQADCSSIIREVLDTLGPVVCQVVLDQQQTFEPRLKSRVASDGKISTPSLEDMFPFLDSEELNSNLLIPPYQG